MTDEKQATRAREPRKLSEIADGETPLEVIRRLNEQDRRNRRLQAQSRQLKREESAGRNMTTRHEKVRTTLNTTSTYLPVFYWGKPAHTKPKAMEGRRVCWKGHGREKAQPQAQEQTADAHSNRNGRPPPATNRQPRKNEANTREKKPKETEKSKEQANEPAGMKMLGRTHNTQ